MSRLIWLPYRLPIKMLTTADQNFHKMLTLTPGNIDSRENNQKSPVLIRSVKLLRRVFSQTTDGESKTPTGTSYPKYLPQSLPFKPSYKDITEHTPAASDSSPEVLGPLLLNVKATVHTLPITPGSKSPNANPHLVSKRMDSSPALGGSLKTPAFKSNFAQQFYQKELEKRKRPSNPTTGQKITKTGTPYNLMLVRIATMPKPPLVPSRPPIALLMAAIIPPLHPLLNQPQCHRCQIFGHVKGSCRRSFN